MNWSTCPSNQRLGICMSSCSRRHEQGNVLISSSRTVDEWDEVYSFGEGSA